MKGTITISNSCTISNSLVKKGYLTDQLLRVCARVRVQHGLDSVGVPDPHIRRYETQVIRCVFIDHRFNQGCNSIDILWTSPNLSPIMFGVLGLLSTTEVVS